MEAHDALRADFYAHRDDAHYELETRPISLVDELKDMVTDMKKGAMKFIEHPEKLIYPDAFLSEDEEDITNPDGL